MVRGIDYRTLNWTWKLAPNPPIWGGGGGMQTYLEIFVHCKDSFPETKTPRGCFSRWSVEFKRNRVGAEKPVRTGESS